MTRVLVVEDEESFSDALSYMLGREGFEAVVARTGPASRIPTPGDGIAASPRRRSTARIRATSSRAEYGLVT